MDTHAGREWLRPAAFPSFTYDRNNWYAGDKVELK
jgi:hypothetical protein